MAARTGRGDWRVEVWGISNHRHLCVRHRHWTGLSRSYYAQDFAGPADGQFSLAAASEIVHAQRVLYRLCRRLRYRRILPVHEECTKFWHVLAKHGYAADRTERRLDLIVPKRLEAHQRRSYRDAVLFPDIVEATRLFASSFWLRQAIGGERESQLFREEFERRLPAERR